MKSTNQSQVDSSRIQKPLIGCSNRVLLDGTNQMNSNALKWKWGGGGIGGNEMKSKKSKNVDVGGVATEAHG